MSIYEPADEEPKILNFWEKEKIYKFNPKKKGKIYSIDTPPPTVSGDMHVGHAFSYSQQDFIARFQRMLSGGIFYPFGTDDNGLPTERLIEKLNNVKSKEMSRSDFIKLCIKTLKDITPNFVQQWKNMGISADYDIYYSTIDKNSQKMSQKSFLDLYNKKRVYKKNFPTLWCPECQTSIAQAELEDKEQETLFTTLKFPTNGKDILIATTRPELLGACTAIFVHPSDKRYKDFVGKKAKVPLFNFEVPVYSDNTASPEKGTGAMMVCSYGDKFDVDAINRYKLTPKIIFNSNGTMKDGRYNGLRIKEARKAILDDLRKEGFIIEQKKISHAVNVHDKCGTEIEFLPTEQWFIRILDKKKEFLSQGKKIKWFPEFMHRRYENWVKGLDWDWNISRDRHFGVPIPVWECKKCREIILAEEKELPIDPSEKEKRCPKCHEKAEPEKKVLDTWATSSLTPQIASSLAGNKIKIPYSLRPQAHEIIRTWAFYAIVKSYFSEGKIPWENIMLSGFIKLHGEKMSKSKGNVIDPKEVMKNYGADSIRFAAAGLKLGDDADYSEKDVLAGRKFLNKLWNASNFVFMNLKNYKPKKPKKLVETDKIFLKEIDYLIKDVTDAFENYNYSAAKLKAEQFFWRDFCDNYLEIVKWRVYNGNREEKESAFYTLYTSLLAILKLIAPIMPFITEKIYQEHFRKNEKDKSIHISGWPKCTPNVELTSKVWPLLLEIISRIRQEKSIAKKSMNAEIILTLDKNYLGRHHNIINHNRYFPGIIEDLKHVTNAKEIKEGKFKVEFI
ncbi:MAG: valine--tRNA ligase [Candidatus Pacearchaeota archaeon]|nr:valine--tRNA ligase [Candidatus Pacearchaeota archaeon]